MDVLALCWVFDKRWMFGVNFQLYLISIPVFIDVLTILGFALQEGSECSTYANKVILGLIVLSLLSIIAISYFKANRDRNSTYPNKHAIDSFMLRYHTKKTIWSLIGLFVLTMSFILLLLESCQACEVHCYSLIVMIRMLIDMACWIYLALMVTIFIVCKLVSLGWAWKFPESFLRYRKVII